MFSYLNKHREDEIVTIYEKSDLVDLGKHTKIPFSSDTSIYYIEPVPINQLMTMSLPKEETLSMVDPVEIRIPMPWGHVAAKTWGNSNGRPVLGVHGWMDNAGTFDKLIPKLSKSLYVVAVDLPGHGRSSHTPNGIPCHYIDFLVHLRRIVNHLKWSRFSWMGHSMGAGLGAYYASMYPTEIDKLVMVDLVKGITAETNNDLAGRMATAIDTFISTEAKITPDPPSYTFEEALHRQMTAIGGTLKEESAKTLMVRGCRRISEDRYVFSRDIRVRTPTIGRISHEQAFAILSNMKCSNLIIKSTQMPHLEPKDVYSKALEIYKKNCATFQYVEVDGDHFVHLNDPEKIADIVNTFLIEPKAGL